MEWIAELDRALTSPRRLSGYGDLPFDAVPPSVFLMATEWPTYTRPVQLGLDAMLIRTKRRLVIVNDDHLLHLASPAAAHERDSGQLGARETASLQDMLDGSPLRIRLAKGRFRRVLFVTGTGIEWTIGHRLDRMSLYRADQLVVRDDGEPTSLATWTDRALWRAVHDSDSDVAGINPLWLATTYRRLARDGDLSLFRT